MELPIDNAVPSGSLTRKKADYYCMQLFGKKVKLSYNPLWSHPYRVERKNRRFPPTLVGMGSTPREAILDAVRRTSPMGDDVAGSRSMPEEK